MGKWIFLFGWIWIFKMVGGEKINVRRLRVLGSESFFCLVRSLVVNY